MKVAIDLIKSEGFFQDPEACLSKRLLILVTVKRTPTVFQFAETNLSSPQYKL